MKKGMLVTVISSILILLVFVLIQLNLSLRITSYLRLNSFDTNSFSNSDLQSEDADVIEEESGVERIFFKFSARPTLKTVLNNDTRDILNNNSDLDKEPVNELDSKPQSELVEEFNKNSKLESGEELEMEPDQDSTKEESEELDSNATTESDGEQVEESKEESKEKPKDEPKEDPKKEPAEDSMPDSTTRTINESPSDPPSKPNIEPSPAQTERPKKAKFNPVGIPFSKKTWFSLFRYYQQVMRSESTVSPDLLRSETNSFSILPGDKVQFLHIPNGCVNLYKRQIIILQNKPDHSFTKTNLRSPNILHEVPLETPIPGFESLPLFLSEATSIPYPTLSSNLTWLFYTPKKGHNTNECMNSLASYLSLFFHSIHPLLPMDVLLFTLFTDS